MDGERQIPIKVTHIFVAGHTRQSIMYALERWTTFFVLTHNGEVAASLLDCTDTVLEGYDPHPTCLKPEQDIAAIKLQIGDAKFEKAYPTGQSMTLEEAV